MFKKILKAFIQEMKKGYKKYLFIYLLFFLFAILFQYRLDITFAIDQVTVLFIYTTLVFSLLLIRYFGSLFHTSERWDKYTPREWPEIDVVIPAYNEGKTIYRTIRSITKADYLKDKLNIVLINDGSSDNTAEYMKKAADDFSDYNISVIDRLENVGKKEAMAVGILGTKSDYLVFVDSDSSIHRKCFKEIVTPFFKDEKIGAVCGNAGVLNNNENLLTQMQEVRYFNAFKTVKAFESLIGFVSCCSGCCSAYRRKAVLPVMHEWLEKSFLGKKCTYGDDRSLTNLILKNDWEAVYNENAKVKTTVPTTLPQYNRQQIRWKKSWLRESAVVLSYVWKKNPLIALYMLIEVFITLLSPGIIAYIFLYLPFFGNYNLINYLIGVVFLGLLIGLFFKIHNQRRKWWAKSLFCSFSNLLFIWQLPYALFTLRDTKWGTR